MSESKVTNTQAEHDGRNDFDFFIGAWKVHHQVLRKRLNDSNAWEEFGGQASAHKVLGGLGNMDEISMEREKGATRGMTLRLYDPQSKQWRLYWADSVTGILQAPMIGSFENGRGVFYDHELFEGRGIFCRYIWSNITANGCRWEQAFSTDGGATWETNWIMDFERI